MRVVETAAELREALAGPARKGASIGFVPTMGFLHAGHVSLLAAARADCDVVVLSLFVNPAQFAPGEDLDRYPRDREGDLATAAEAGVDLVFAPSEEEIYPPGFSTTVDVGGITEVLEGDPGLRGREHFRGVTTIVAKLLVAVGPDVAYFGQKDAQQAIVIRRMTRDLGFATRIDVRPTVREADGLAMSSRNAYLEPADRERAPAIHRAIAAAAEAARTGAHADEVLTPAHEILADAGIAPEYLEIRDAVDLEPVEILNGRPALIAVAAQVGAARLIDNVTIERQPSRERNRPS